ncbi:hypothetical protein OK016_27560 [Vibrio chagasii]|nr:hypothetical protein [Vibrio chagasii]
MHLGYTPKWCSFVWTGGSIRLNIANVDTPNYKAMDLRFEAVLQWYWSLGPIFRYTAARSSTVQEHEMATLLS